MVLVARGSLEEAEKFFQKAVEIDPEVLSFEVGGPWSNERKSSYGELLTNFGRYKEAERYLLIALDELKNRFVENDKRIWRPLSIQIIGFGIRCSLGLYCLASLLFSDSLSSLYNTISCICDQDVTVSANLH